MNNMATVQIRTSESLKANAVDILEKLGLNLSTYINMSLNQLVIQKRIPFEVALKSTTYTVDETVAEVSASMSMEGLELTEEELETVRLYRSGELSGDKLRAQIINEASQNV